MSDGIFQLRRTGFDVSVENNRSRETSTCFIALSREEGKKRKRCQFFSSRKRDCHRRSNLSPTRMTDRSTRRNEIFGRTTRSREILLVIVVGKSKVHISIVSERNILANVKQRIQRGMCEVYNWYNFSKEY